MVGGHSFSRTARAPRLLLNPAPVLALALWLGTTGGVARAQGGDGEPAATPTPAPTPAPTQAPEDPATAEAPGTSPDSEGATEAPAKPEPPWADDHQWVNTGIRRAVSGLVGLPDGTLVAITTRGEVQRRAPGRGWRVVLSEPGIQGSEGIDAEDMLLDAESAVEDFSDSGPSPSFGTDEGDPDATTEDGTDTSSESSQGPVDVGSGDLLDAGLIDSAGRMEAGQASVLGVWAVSAGQGVVATRADGAWRSEDGGRTWSAVPTLPGCHDIVAFPGFPNELIAATVDGVLQSGNGGESWFEVESTLSGEVINDLNTDGDWIYAGTEAGLFRSKDGQRWSAARAGDGAGVPIRAIAVDPAWEGGLWLAGPMGVLRSDDFGATVRVSGRNPLVGTRVLVSLPEPGRVLAAGDDGVWESIDGGVRWSPVVDGIPGPEQRALVVDAESVVLGGEYGVWRLGRAVALEEIPGGAIVSSTVVLPPMGELVELSLRRSGVSYDPVIVQRALLASYLAPRLRLTGRLDRPSKRSARFSGMYNEDNEALDWTFGLSMCFGPCGNVTDLSYDADYGGSYGDYSDYAEYSGSGDAPELAAYGDQVYDANDRGSFAASAANTVEGLSKYRRFLAESVSGLYTQRLRLERQRGSVASLPLREQVSFYLDVAEADAHLDAYTDGYFIRALDERGPPPPAADSAAPPAEDTPLETP
jgi:hypothetical protein